MYEYQSSVLRVIDGDTVELIVDLGFRLRVDLIVRLYGINAPEIRTIEGKAAKARLSELLPKGAAIRITTLKDKTEKYGRYLGILSDGDGHEINARMVSEGHAVPYLP